MKVGTSIKRRTRVRKEWLAKEEFACKKCGAEDKDICWDKRTKILFCKKCGHKLTEKEELEEELIFKEIQQYGFWMRFVKEHFVPCKKCQDKLHISLFRSGTWYINDDNMGVDFAVFGRQCYFSIRWLTKALYFTPCQECADHLKEIILSKELCIGNKDTEPAIELWRKWSIIDELEQQK